MFHINGLEGRSGSVDRVVDLGSKCHKFETHQYHCVVSLSKTLYPLLSTGSTQEDRKASQHDWDLKHQHK